MRCTLYCKGPGGALCGHCNDGSKNGSENGVGNGRRGINGQGRNGTADTRIFSPTWWVGLIRTQRH